jgi:hypothetical protein
MATDMLHQNLSPYEVQARHSIERIDTIDGTKITVESEVNFFLLALEAAGAKVRFTCGGHPSGFYIVFRCDYELALKIHSCGYFTTELTNKSNEWVLSLRNNQRGIECESGQFTALDRDRLLSAASFSWVSNGFSI